MNEAEQIARAVEDATGTQVQEAAGVINPDQEHGGTEAHIDQEGNLVENPVESTEKAEQMAHAMDVYATLASNARKEGLEDLAVEFDKKAEMEGKQVEDVWNEQMAQINQEMGIIMQNVGSRIGEFLSSDNKGARLAGFTLKGPIAPYLATVDSLLGIVGLDDNQKSAIRNMISRYAAAEANARNELKESFRSPLGLQITAYASLDDGGKRILINIER